MADPTVGGGTEGLREALARAIEPASWAVLDKGATTPVIRIGRFRQRAENSLRIADALLAGPLARASAEQARVEAERAGLRTALVALSRVVDEDRLKADAPAQAAFDLALKLPEAPDAP